ncbi:uracil-DNA glycosylase, family 4 [Methanolobus tindarius DSM 2278]|uniref:Type-4 uracil-DNA glycosylase n=1 Tax=Methanolobus tindarius DSM 2278 TaxID=1090322 RepID=W9DPI9_METTI|nr:uracil-DNA glycosylase [Methanolobus tindarius]ETA67163.1 uracil-DNA glycosylase, family 4 [Methanolobus tindarius DSM 2278]
MAVRSVSKLVEQGFEAVEKEILECKDCQLHETVTNKVISKGSRTPSVVFVGEAPGKNEDETGVPFCGRAGKNLDGMIEYMGLSGDEYAVINTIKCRPPKNRNPLKSEIKACKPFLEAQIQLLNPKVIILLGNTAEKAFCDGDKLEWGVPKAVDGKYTLLKIYHPAALIYQRSRIEEQNTLIDNNRHLWELE